MSLEILKLFPICLGNRWAPSYGEVFYAVIILKLNDVNVWAGITRYFGAKQRIVIESYSTVNIMLCNVTLKKE